MMELNPSKRWKYHNEVLPDGIVDVDEKADGVC